MMMLKPVDFPRQDSRELTGSIRPYRVAELTVLSINFRLCGNNSSPLPFERSQASGALTSRCALRGAVSRRRRIRMDADEIAQ